MVKILQFALETYLGWLVITCGVPADSSLFRPWEPFTETPIVCMFNLNGRNYGLAGALADLDRVADKARFSMEDYQ